MRRDLSLNDIVLGNLRRRGKQNVLLVLGVSLAVFFLSVSVFGGGCILASYDEYQKNTYGEANLVLSNAGDAPIADMVSSGLLVRYAVEECLYESVGDPENRDDDFAIARGTPEVIAMTRARLVMGEFPDEPGEIAVESAALARMRTSAKIGDEIAFSLNVYDGEKPIDARAEKTFTLVGVLENRGCAVNDKLYSGRNSLLAEIAEAFVSPEEPLIPGTRAVNTALCVQANGVKYEDISAWCESHLPSEGENRFYLDEVYAYIDGMWSDMLPVFLSVGLIFIALTFVAMAGIASALTSSIDKRKSQIGMLRAIGATGKQIRKLLLRETLGVTVLTLPVGIGLALSLLYALSRIFPRYFVFSVPIGIVFADIAACGICVALSSLLPVRRSMKISPMQAVRDVDLTRNFRWTERKSRETFVPQQLLAQRNSALRPGRTAGHTALVAAGALLFTVAFAMCVNMTRQYGYDSVPADYEVHNGGVYFGQFLNESFYSGRLTSRDVSEISALPYVGRVESAQGAAVNLLVDTVSDYCIGGGLLEEFSYLSPNLSVMDERLIASGKFPFMEQRIGGYKERNLARYEAYKGNMETLGWEGEALLSAVTGFSAGYLEDCEAHVREGRIDIAKLATGEEVLLVAPEKYAMKINISEDGDGYGFTKVENDKITPEYTDVFTYDFVSAGDEIRLGFIWSNDEANGEALPEEYEAFSRTVKVGAILSECEGNNGPFPVTLVTSEAGLAALGIDANYCDIRVYLSGEPDEETREYISESIAGIASRSSDGSFFDRYESARQNRRTSFVIISTCATLMLLLFAFTWALLNGAVAGRVQSEVRQIGTMRAVGASKRAVFASYARQLARIFAVGGAIGWALSIFGVWFSLYSYSTDRFWTEGIRYCLTTPLYLLPLYGLCLWGLRSKLRPVFKASVVDNIRIL